MKRLISFVIRYVPRKYLQRVSGIALKTLSVFYSGNDVECPVCDSTFRKFLPYGRVPRPNVLCPSCQSLERHRLIWLYLKNKTNFFIASNTVLHVAPEDCFIHRFEKMPNLDYITGDIESPLAKVKMDIHSIPFEDNTFDVAFCNHVMEHVEDDIMAMSELYRVLKPGGWAIIQIPLFHPLKDSTYEDASITDPKEREKAFGQSDHVRLYGKDYADRLRKGGFEVTEDWYVKELEPVLAERFRLPMDEPIFFCRKTLD
ncbi:class I SAM-dependent methyltransferase [Roseivirga sp. BDSF3-8]|uniref:class I SAM-dependent methyltransferase n=1 Tax=Roseivirga sp. BDSF3-8 TaxID=3241598 RepID=UPI0035322D38